jgi:hypothetical protein
MKIYTFGLKRRYFFLIVFIFVIVLILHSYVTLIRSDAYSESLYFICTNPEVAGYTGKISAIKFRVLTDGESYISEVGNDGDANIPLELEGEKGNVAIDIYLERKARLWYVMKADIEKNNVSILVDSSQEKKCNCVDRYCQHGNSRKYRNLSKNRGF